MIPGRYIQKGVLPPFAYHKCMAISVLRERGDWKKHSCDEIRPKPYPFIVLPNPVPSNSKIPASSNS